MRLTTQVELMVQFEGIVRSQLIAKPIQNFLKKSISIRMFCKTSIISIKPNEKRGWVSKTYRVFATIVKEKTLNKVIIVLLFNAIFYHY